VVVAGGLGTGGLVIFSRWRCLKGHVVIKILNNSTVSNGIGEHFEPFQGGPGSTEGENSGYRTERLGKNVSQQGRPLD
jgi:hypothetical protein